MRRVSLTGDRPTGKLHLGHFVGSLETRLRLQDSFEQYIMIADLQALTHNADRSVLLLENIYNVMLDYLSIGLDKKKNTFFVQSSIPALFEITFYYMNLVTLGRLHRNPTVKQEMLEKGFEDSVPAGFFCHPISQAADITAFQADVVPAGEDQKPLIEQTNEIVRKFNQLYGEGCIKEIEIMYGNSLRLMGIDGKLKASKSLNNAIFLSDSTEEVKEKVYSMYTDPNHIKVSDPGKVEGNVVFHYLDAFYKDKEHLQELKAHYTRGGLGDMYLKKILFSTIEELLIPIRERRSKLTRQDVEEVLTEGNLKAKNIANKTLHIMREKIGLFKIN
jgi:tryptophanyl-tRNA synthetase